MTGYQSERMSIYNQPRFKPSADMEGTLRAAFIMRES